MVKPISKETLSISFCSGTEAYADALCVGREQRKAARKAEREEEDLLLLQEEEDLYVPELVET